MEPAAGPAIEAAGLSKSYGTVQAVRDVSFTVARGEFFALIGPNGAGKTTLFRMLLGLTLPTAGTIKVNGTDVSRVWSREVRARTGYLPENIAFYDQMTGLGTLRFLSRIKKSTPGEIPGLLEKVGLAGDAERKVAEYSKGMRQRLGLAQALMGGPDLLFLDEPTSGLDPEGIWDFYTILREARERGVTVVTTSHILKEIQDRVDRLGIIAGGRLIAAGTVADLRKELGLKPVIHVTLEGGADRARRAAEEAGGEVVAESATRLTVSTGRENKLEVVRSLAAVQGVVDIELGEPSLEDVFMGYARRGAR